MNLDVLLKTVRPSLKLKLNSKEINLQFCKKNTMCEPCLGYYGPCCCRGIMYRPIIPSAELEPVPQSAVPPAKPRQPPSPPPRKSPPPRTSPPPRASPPAPRTSPPIRTPPPARYPPARVPPSPPPSPPQRSPPKKPRAPKPPKIPDPPLPPNPPSPPTFPHPPHIKLPPHPIQQIPPTPPPSPTAPPVPPLPEFHIPPPKPRRHSIRMEPQCRPRLKIPPVCVQHKIKADVLYNTWMCTKRSGLQDEYPQWLVLGKPYPRPGPNYTCRTEYYPAYNNCYNSLNNNCCYNSSWYNSINCNPYGKTIREIENEMLKSFTYWKLCDPGKAFILEVPVIPPPPKPKRISILNICKSDSPCESDNEPTNDDGSMVKAKAKSESKTDLPDPCKDDCQCICNLDICMDDLLSKFRSQNPPYATCN